MTALETRYRRLLRWYPASWRAAHGDVLLGTLMDAAEAAGRDRPTPAEAWSMRLTGAGEQLTPRFGFFSTLVAFVLGVCGLLVLILSDYSSAFEPWRIALTGMLAPTALSAAVICLLRRSRSLTPRGGVLLLAAVGIAWTFAALAQWSWSIGFDEADAGLPRSAFSSAFAALFIAGWAAGGFAIAVTTRAAMSYVPAPIGWSLGVVFGLIVPPILGVATINPIVMSLIAVAGLIGFGVARGNQAHRARHNPPRSA